MTFYTLLIRYYGMDFVEYIVVQVLCSGSPDEGSVLVYHLTGWYFHKDITKVTFQKREDEYGLKTHRECVTCYYHQ